MKILPRLLLQPSKIIKFGKLQIFGLVIILFVIAQKSNALFFLWSMTVGAATAFGWNFFGSSDVAGHVISVSGDISVGGDMFYRFYQGLDIWLITVYTKFAVAVMPLLQIAVTIAVIVTGLGFYFGRLADKLPKIIKFIFWAIIVITFIESYDLFKYWFIDSLIDIQEGIFNILLGTSDSVLAITDTGKRISTAIFAPVDGFFIEIFGRLKDFKDGMKSNILDSMLDFDKLLVFFILMLAYGFLYAIFFILIMISFFGFFLLLGFMPIVLFISLFYKPLFNAWLKTTLNYFLIAIFTAAVMSMTMEFMKEAINAISNLENENAIFSIYFVTAMMIAIFSVGLHWKVPEFAAGHGKWCW